MACDTRAFEDAAAAMRRQISSVGRLCTVVSGCSRGHFGTRVQHDRLHDVFVKI